MNYDHACANGCRTRPDDDGNRYPVRTDSAARICARCEDRLGVWLEQIPDAFALLPWVRQPGTVDTNPESQQTKRADAPVPVRLNVIDLTDQRHGRRFEYGTEPADDRRGALGLLESWARLVREEKRIAPPTGPTAVYGEARLLSRHLLWISEQPWVAEFYTDIKNLHRAIADAVGDYRPRPVGRCHLPTDDAQATCGGPLMPDDDSDGVHCPRCGTHWTSDYLRLLGLAQGQLAADDRGTA